MAKKQKIELEDLEWEEDNTGASYSKQMTCTNHECKCYFNRDENFWSLKYISQIAKGVRRTDERGDRPYILSLECSECSTKFWYHLDETRARVIAHYRGIKEL